jgi:cation diffusion facilitator CzcD-associated flavoprotein CzcO
MASPVDADVIVVGAGFGGIGMAIQLESAGFPSFLILERADDVGGTWRDNVYPGCACDIPSMLYSFSFERNFDWTRLFPKQAEIWDYLKATVKHRALRDRIRFGTDVSEARFDEAAATWHVRTADGPTFSSRVLVTAMGALSKPNVPHLPGIERFSGPRFHSSQWDFGVDLRDKNVATIGTGASAIQFVPEIAQSARHVTVFQRTPPWIIPRPDGPVGPWQRRLRRFAPYAKFVRAAIYWLLELRALGFVVNPNILKVEERVALRHLESQIADPELRAKVTPHYRLGCKRVLISDDYYPALQRPNVSLETSPIAEVRESSIVTSDGVEHPADVIVYGTGFRATDGVTPVRVYGRDGRELNETWRAGMEAYLGTNVAGFPNLFLIIGPNTGLGHNSMIYMMEAQYRYVLSALKTMRALGVRAVDVKPDAQSRYNARIQRKMRGTVWSTGCRSWYLDANGKNTTLWPGFTFAFRRATRRFRPEAYTLLRLGKRDAAPRRSIA